MRLLDLRKGRAGHARTEPERVHARLGGDRVDLDKACLGKGDELIVAFVGALQIARKDCVAQLIPLSKACFIEVNPIPAKAGMNALGFRAGTPRAPLSEIEEPHRAVLLNAMKEFGLEVKA